MQHDVQNCNTSHQICLVIDRVARSVALAASAAAPLVTPVAALLVTPAAALVTRAAAPVTPPDLWVLPKSSQA